MYSTYCQTTKEEPFLIFVSPRPGASTHDASRSSPSYSRVGGDDGTAPHRQEHGHRFDIIPTQPLNTFTLWPAMNRYTFQDVATSKRGSLANEIEALEDDEEDAEGGAPRAMQGAVTGEEEAGGDKVCLCILALCYTNCIYS